MKNLKKVLLLVVVLVLFSSQLFGVAWRVERHKLGSSDLADQINGWTTRGYAPMGMTLRDNALYIFYYKGKSLNFSTWSIRVYASISELKDAMSDKIDDGYVPTGFTMKGNKIFIMYLKIKNNVKAWRLIWSKGDTLASFRSSVQPWLAKNYIPTGISLHNGRYYTLLLKIPDTKFSEWKILRDNAQTDKLKVAVDKMILRKGWVPWAFSYREGLTYTVYLK